MSALNTALLSMILTVADIGSGTVHAESFKQALKLRTPAFLVVGTTVDSKNWNSHVC